MAQQSDQYCDILDEELGIGPTISQNLCKALDECIRSMVIAVPSSSSKTKDKDRVRRPMNAFMLYSQTARKVMAKAYPTLSYRKLSKVLGKIWKLMDPEEKKPFIEEAERIRILHKQQHPNFKFNTNQKPRVGKSKGPGKAKKSKTEILPTVQDLLDMVKPDMSMTTGNVSNSFQITPNSTCAAFSDDNANPLPLSYNDQEFLFLLDSILNDATVNTTEAQTNGSMQFAATNNAYLPGYIPTNDSVGQHIACPSPSNQNSNFWTRNSFDNALSLSLSSDLDCNLQHSPLIYV